MTAPLPVPQESPSEYPESAEDVRALGRVVPLPPKPPIPAEEAAAEREAAEAGPKPPSKPPRKPSRPRRPKAPPAPVEPGPPPPLPADVIAQDVVVPPKPPLPVAEASPFSEPVADSATDVVGAPVGDHGDAEDGLTAASDTLAELQILVEEAVEPDPVVETETLAEPEPHPEPEPEPVAEAASEVLTTAEAEPVVTPEPAPELAPELAPEPAEPEPAEPEPEILAEPEPEPDAAAAIAAVFEDDGAVEPSAEAPALVVRGLTKSFGGTRAVDGIDLTIPAGSFYGLVGPNGAGKTTTLSMIAGLLRPDRGSIEVNGVDAASDSVEAKRMMGVLPDRLRTFDRLTGRQLLYYYGVLRRLPPALVESRTNDLARAFDLTDALGRMVSDYSAGMAKKVMLAGAMIHSPRLLVLDEPFEAVDPVSSAIILDILGTYVAHGGTVILSSHGMELVERVCSRVAVIVAGQVLAEGTVAEVRGELTLEQRFIELAGGLSDVEGLEWLHTFSD